MTGMEHLSISLKRCAITLFSSSSDANFYCTVANCTSDGAVSSRILFAVRTSTVLRRLSERASASPAGLLATPLKDGLLIVAAPEEAAADGLRSGKKSPSSARE